MSAASKLSGQRCLSVVATVTDGVLTAPQAWHALSGDEVATHLGVDPERGLSTADAVDRLQRFGPNSLATERRGTVLRVALDQFADTLVWLLIIAALVSGLLLDAWLDAIAIGSIVVINAVIGFTQETRANSALARLREMEAPTAIVFRNGARARIDAATLVPGDLVTLEAGDLVPADGRVLAEMHLVTDEAPLTGESMPVIKTSEQAPSEAHVPDRRSMVFAGTSVVAGRGSFIVTGTGASTEMGKIAALMSEESPETPLQVELSRVGRRLGIVAGAAALLIFGAGLARSYPIEVMVLTAVALAVAAIPEGLPAVVTVSLSGGLQRMAHRNAIVRRLPAVESLGVVDVICTDKTGTLTAPQLEVADVVLADQRTGLHVLDEDDELARWLLATAYLCNDAYQTDVGWEGDPTEVALKSVVDERPASVGRIQSSGYQRIDEAGFDSRRKRMSTVQANQSGTYLLTKGAPEVLVSRSTHVWGEDGPATMTEADRSRILMQAEELAAAGMRTLGMAMRFDPEDGYSDPADLERSLTFLGIFGLREKVRPEVPGAIRSASEAGVRTVMVTGDHATTAQSVARSVGIDGGEAMEGSSLSAMDLDDLTQSIADYSVFARVDPADKVKIVRAWQDNGAKVAVTGDGVNDAPALHRADIGVAMGSGSEVAREAAGIVLTDDNYATIVSAIAEGRRLFSNLRNVVHYLLSANASEVIFVLTGFVVFGDLGIPLTAVQLLWINLISDSLPAIALGMDRPTRNLMADPPGRGRDILSNENVMRLLVQGSVLASAAVGSLLVGSFIFDLPQPSVQTMVFTTLVVSQLLHALNVRYASTRRLNGDIAQRPGPLMISAIIGSMVLHLAVVYTGLGQRFFGTEPLVWTSMAAALSLALMATVVIRVLNRRSTFS